MSKITDALKKVGFIEDDGTESLIFDEQMNEIRKKTQQMLDSSLETVELPEEISLEGLLSVEEIYVQFKIGELSKSIYKVNDFVKALPDNLPTDVKKQSVLGILKATNLEVADLLNDANTRIGALSETINEFSGQTETIIEKGNIEIESLQVKIDEIKQQINDRKKLQESQESLINEEIEKINGIIKFIG